MSVDPSSSHRMFELRDTIDLPSAPESVWPFLAEPHRWPDWNPKVVQVEGSSERGVLPGQRFWATHRLGTRQRRLLVEVAEVDEPRRLRFVSALESAPARGGGEESWEIERRAGGCRVRHRVSLSGIGMPLPIRVLAWALHRFGRPVGPTVLEALGRVIAAAEPIQ